MLKSGCYRVMLTGGEPLLLKRETLLKTVEAITSFSELKHTWITTNGSLLTKDMSKDLYKHGLRRVVVSISAKDSETYQSYTGKNNADLNLVLNNIKSAKEAGLEVRVDVPLNTSGIHSYEELKQLIDIVSQIGVTELAYFRLHKTEENAKQFDNLYTSTNSITRAFQEDNTWKIITRTNGQEIFTRKGFNVIIPAKIRVDTERCISNSCGKYCQGTYASYLIIENNRVYLRACHHEFSNHRNEFDIPIEVIKNRDKKNMTAIFTNVWRYAYGNE